MLVAQEDVVVTVTHEGYIKRSSIRSYTASKPEEIGMKEGDFLLYAGEVNTLDHLLLVTNKGNMIYRPSMSCQIYAGKKLANIFLKPF